MGIYEIANKACQRAAAGMRELRKGRFSLMTVLGLSAAIGLASGITQTTYKSGYEMRGRCSEEVPTYWLSRTRASIWTTEITFWEDRGIKGTVDGVMTQRQSRYPMVQTSDLEEYDADDAIDSQRENDLLSEGQALLDVKRAKGRHEMYRDALAAIQSHEDRWDELSHNTRMNGIERAFRVRELKDEEPLIQRLRLEVQYYEAFPRELGK